MQTNLTSIWHGHFDIGTRQFTSVPFNDSSQPFHNMEPFKRRKSFRLGSSIRLIYIFSCSISQNHGHSHQKKRKSSISKILALLNKLKEESQLNSSPTNQLVFMSNEPLQILFVFNTLELVVCFNEPTCSFICILNIFSAFSPQTLVHWQISEMLDVRRLNANKRAI